jgi:uncharacterized protein YggU (UPF0235/DUF167 family)
VSSGYDGVLLNLRVSPGAKRSSIEGPAADGRANAEAEHLIQGASSRDKVVLVRGVGQTETRKLLSAYLP